MKCGVFAWQLVFELPVKTPHILKRSSCGTRIRRGHSPSHCLFVFFR